MAVIEIPELVDPATLALTELVANVVRHVPDRKAALLILRRPGGVRVEVTDADPRPPQSPSSTAVDEPEPEPELELELELAKRGRGLLILDAVTDRWGWRHLSDSRDRPDRPGNTVWFECDTKSTKPPTDQERQFRDWGKSEWPLTLPPRPPTELPLPSAAAYLFRFRQREMYDDRRKRRGR